MNDEYISKKDVLIALGEFSGNVGSLDWSEEEKIAARWGIVNSMGIINHDIPTKTVADIEIGGKKYRLTDAPILKTRDKSGLCSICGFREVEE